MILILSVWVLHNRLSFKNFPDFTFIYGLTGIVKFELVATTSHAKNFESVNFRDETRSGHHCVVEML